MRVQVIKAAFWGVTGVVAVAVAGLIGYYQGFARAIGVTDLDRSLAVLLADGVQMIRDAPGHIFEAGLAGTGSWLVAVGSLIAAAGLLAIAILATLRGPVDLGPRPGSPPDPRGVRHGRGDSDSIDVSGGTIALVALGETVVLLVAIAHAAWTIMRHHAIGEHSILEVKSGLDAWIDSARIAAGIDLIALVAVIVWLLFALRIPSILPWLKILSVILIGGAVAISFAAASISVGTMTHINTPRPVVDLSQGVSADSGLPVTDIVEEGTDQRLGSLREPALLVGRTGTHLVLLREPANPYLFPSNQPFEIEARMRLPAYLAEMHERAASASSASEPAEPTESDEGDDEG